MKIPVIIVLVIFLWLCSFPVFPQKIEAVKSPESEAVTNLAEHYDRGYLFMDISSIIKTDVNGNVRWKKYIGSTNYSTHLHSISTTSDGGFIIAGSTNKYNGRFQPLFIKFSPCGQIEWCKVIITQYYSNIRGTDITQLPDGRIKGIVSYNDPSIPMESATTILLSFLQNGQDVLIDTVRREPPDQSPAALGYKFVPSEDSNMVIAAVPYYPLDWPVWYKIDTTSHLLWEQSSSGEGRISDTKSDYAGHFYSTATIKGFDPAFIKFNQAGTGFTVYEPWTSKFIELGMLCCYDPSIILALVSGKINGADNSSGISVIDSAGNLLHYHQLYQAAYNEKSIIKTRNSKILYLENINPSLSIIPFLKFEYTGAPDYLVAVPSDPGTYTYDSLCTSVITTDTLDIEAELITGVYKNIESQDHDNILSVWPIPSKDIIHIHFEDMIQNGDLLMICNIEGNLICRIPVSQGLKETKLDIKGYSGGIYLVKWQRKNVTMATVKFVR